MVKCIRDAETIGDEGSAKILLLSQSFQNERNRGLDGFEEKQTSSMSGRRDPHNMENLK